MHLHLPLTNLKNPCQGGLESVIVLGKGAFANETSKVLQNHFPSKYFTTGFSLHFTELGF